MLRVSAVISVAAFVAALLLNGGAGVVARADSSATPAAAAAHALVGSWVIDTDDANPVNAPGLAIFAADGTYIELHEREPDGAGIWVATGEDAAEVTIVFHSIDAELALEATVTVQAEVTVDASGDRFTAPYTLEITAPEGTTIGELQGTATGTRITADGAVPMASPVAS